MRKGDISINLMMVMIVTIISILMLVALFSAKVPTFSKSIYCKTFFYVHSATFVPKFVRQDQSYCKEQTALYDPIIITNETSANTTLLAHMIACWELSEFGRLNNNMLCYELVPSANYPVPTTITEQEITSLMEQEDVCPFFHNSIVDGNPIDTCGDRDDIVWNFDGVIEPDKNILIEYVNNQIMIS